MRKKRYWLRGGIGGVIMDLIVIISSFGYFAFCFRSYGDPPAYCSSIGFLNYPAKFLFFFDSLISNIVFYLVAGVVIGWTYGKIKNRSKVKNPEIH